VEDGEKQDVTVLLSRIRAGEADAGRELLPLLYGELRGLAGKMFRGQKSEHTLQPTVLVHEAFLKMVGKPTDWKDRGHFFAVAAMAMRQILVNHARDKSAQKRGGGNRPAILHDEAVGKSQSLDVLELHEALEKLAAIDERKHKIVELRFFGGLTMDEIAELLQLSKSTVEADWRAAKAWLAVALG
jgi:RNA polymerase sigma-70 factor, ECF subfamily